MRLAPEEISNNLTGFGHNAVTCIGMKTDIPVIKYCTQLSGKPIFEHILVKWKFYDIIMGSESIIVS